MQNFPQSLHYLFYLNGKKGEYIISVLEIPLLVFEMRSVLHAIVFVEILWKYLKMYFVNK